MEEHSGIYLSLSRHCSVIVGERGFRFAVAFSWMEVKTYDCLQSAGGGNDGKADVADLF